MADLAKKAVSAIPVPGGGRSKSSAGTRAPSSRRKTASRRAATKGGARRKTAARGAAAKARGAARKTKRGMSSMKRSVAQRTRSGGGTKRGARTRGGTRRKK
jgi:hypothetical protein